MLARGSATGGGEGRGRGKQIWRTLRPNSVCFENVLQMRYFALCVLNMLDVCFRDPPNGGDGGRGRTKNAPNTAFFHWFCVRFASAPNYVCFPIGF